MNLKENLSDYYDNNADYRETAEKREWKLNLRKQFLVLLKNSGHKTLLEIGAGTGQDSLYFKDNGMKVTAMDLSEKHIAYCNEKGLHAVIMDFYNMDFPDDSYDSLFAMNCLLHVPRADLPKVFRELKRVVKAGGILFVGNYGGQNFEGPRKREGFEGSRFFSIMEMDEYKPIIEKAGFHVLESRVIETGIELGFNFFLLRNDK